MLWWRNNQQPRDYDHMMVEFEQSVDDDGDGGDTDEDEDDSDTWQQHQLHDGNPGEDTQGRSQNRG